MSLSDNFRQLAALIEALESHEVTVREAAPVNENGGQSPEDSFVVQLEVGIPSDSPVERLALNGGADIGARPDRPTSAAATSTDEADSGEAPARSGDDEATTVTDGVTRDSTSSDTASGRDEEHETVEDGMVDEGETVEDETVDEGETVEDETVDEEDAAVGASTETTADSSATPEDSSTTPEEPDTNEPEPPVVCTDPDCDRTFETERGMKIHRTKAHPLSEVAERVGTQSTHYDPEALRRVYDEYETFAEMTAALDVDVGAQAVRKQMIRHGIHDPGGRSKNGQAGDSAAESSANSGDDSADESRDDTSASEPADTETSVDMTETAVVADELPDLDLPGDLTTEGLMSAVESANTLYDVQRALDIDRETAHDLLSTYDLLDLVTGRAAMVHDREAQKDELHERIRRAAT